MTDQDGIKLVFTGSCIDANYIKSILEDNGIGAMVRDSLKESTIASFASGSPENACRVFVSEDHKEKAEKLIQEFLKSNR